MRVRSLHQLFRHAAPILLLVAVSSCGEEAPRDPNNRELDWTYGPTTATATRDHLNGTGKQGPGPIAKGWKCRLVDGKRITIVPYELSASHALFGKVALSVGLFDRTGKQLGNVRSDVLTQDNASFTFEIEADVAKALLDLVIWYVGV